MSQKNNLNTTYMSVTPKPFNYKNNKVWSVDAIFIVCHILCGSHLPILLPHIPFPTQNQAKYWKLYLSKI